MSKVGKSTLSKVLKKFVRASKVMSENVPMKTQIIKNHLRDCHGYELIELIIELIALLEIS
jgi:hypothetical protein